MSKPAIMGIFLLVCGMIMIAFSIVSLALEVPSPSGVRTITIVLIALGLGFVGQGIRLMMVKK